MNIQCRHSGFTLLEMIIVVSIIAILAAVAVPIVGIVQSRERTEATVKEMQILKEALEAYYEDHLEFPEKLEDLEKEGYVSSAFREGDAFLDGWGRPYLYEAGEEEATITSYGEDQVDSERNLTLKVSAKPILRARTKDEMKTIHNALRRYEAQRLDDPSLPELPDKWYDKSHPENSALGILIARGFLPNNIDYARDAWGDVYEYEGSPADYVTSRNVP
jgi:general secretion pathway protein G